jgi:DNA-binding NarL/FixJ family response regulator
MTKIKIFLADDHIMFRDGLKYILTENKSCEIIGEAGNGREAFDLIHKLKPDIVILDISMPLMTGLEASRLIKKYDKNIKIIILTRHDNEEYVKQAIKYGVNAFILKENAGDDLLKAVKDVMNGNLYLSPKLLTSMVHKGILSQDKPEKDETETEKNPLTNREREILKLVAEGKRNKDIASILRISPKTAKAHRLKIMNKLNIHNVTDLVKYAIKSGIIDI